MALDRAALGVRPTADVRSTAGVRSTPGVRSTAGPGVSALLVGTVALQISYPLLSGAARDVITVATVVLGGAAMLGHAAQSRGRLGLAVLVLACVVGGFGVEMLGVHTGFPFGAYRYTGSLGPRLAGVPVVIALAWPMLAWPAALAARRLVTTFPARVLLGGWALAAWDLFLDPQLVAAGQWRWLDPDPHLPGVTGVPLGNYAGWLVIALLMSAVLQCVVGRRSGSDGGPLAFYVWTWASSTLALLAFLHLPAAALWGALAMGTVAVPLIVSWARSR